MKVNESDWQGAGSLEADLLQFVASEATGDPSAELGPDTDLLLSGLVDSLGVVQIVGWLEDRLSISIEPVDVVLENFQTVSAIMAYVLALPPGQ